MQTTKKMHTSNNVFAHCNNLSFNDSTSTPIKYICHHKFKVYTFIHSILSLTLYSLFKNILYMGTCIFIENEIRVKSKIKK